MVPLVSSPIEVFHRAYYVCHKVSHLAKDYPHRVIRAAFILIMGDRGTTKGMRGRGGGACGDSCGTTQPVGGHGQIQRWRLLMM